MWVKIIDNEKKLAVCSNYEFENAFQGEVETGYDGKVYLKGFAPDKTTDIKARELRYERDKLLSQSDWTQIQDNPMSAEKKRSWANYRQLLRDIPSQNGFPETVSWPKQPE